MRRMRDLSWHHLFWLIPLLAVLIGVPYSIKRRLDKEIAGVASAPPPAIPVIPQAKLAPPEKSVAGADKEGGLSFTEPKALKPAPAVAMNELPWVKHHVGNACASIEFPGPGTEAAEVSEEDWKTVMHIFHDAKSRLLAWLKDHRKEIPEKTADWMGIKIATLKVQRPPLEEQPDLNWRGIGILTPSEKGENIVRVGGGFVKLARKEPTRARFELARLIAQSWAPCEIQQVHLPDAWEPVMKCLNVKDESACAVGSYSEGGWAVSSTIAALASPPGCPLEALASPDVKACLDKSFAPVHASGTAPAREASGTAPKALANAPAREASGTMEAQR